MRKPFSGIELAKGFDGEKRGEERFYVGKSSVSTKKNDYSSQYRRDSELRVFAYILS